MAGKGKKTPPKTKRNLRGEAAANVSTSGSESSEEETNEEVTQMLRDIKKSQQFLADKFDAFEKIVANLLTENKNLNDNITTLQQNSTQQEQKIENMFTEVNYYKQKLLEKDVVIGGLPNLENIKPETVLEKIDKIYNFGLQNVDQIFAITGKNRLTKKPYNNIIIKFTSNRAKECLINQQSEKGLLLWGQLYDDLEPNLAQNKIFINERLTPENLTILNAARKLRNDGVLVYVWHKHDTILCKPTADSRAISIQSIHELSKFKKN
jgi:hypothetical protein